MTEQISGSPRPLSLRSSGIILISQRVATTIMLVLALACVSPLAAQTFRGTILGTVTDSNGAVIPGADVMAVNVGTGIMRSTVADADGNTPS